ncbi:Rrf2 family transcriptional regulator [Desulfosporosinus sp. FKB]|uniref:RrF2 family transcriptional regulator n=1 Tax=Desulfosporosinus sp. FKB TaxID=1969835 RepID=UPI000B49A3B7|nr:Rrf2 family transcriptional regulator [Desulfosporosinus sp. FKB]
MKYTKATNYALHMIVYMIEHAQSGNLSLHTLADHFNVSATYLSKILTQLVKADLIESTSGANGGYALRKKMEDISYMDVIKATEGTGSLFECKFQEGSKCLIQNVMAEAENLMETYLRDKKLYEVAKIQIGKGKSF